MTDNSRRHRRRYVYDPLKHSPEAIKRLGDRSLTKELALLCLRLADLQADPDPDWEQTLRTLGVFVRLLRAEQSNPETDSEGLETLREFGRQVEETFRRPDPDEFRPSVARFDAQNTVD